VVAWRTIAITAPIAIRVREPDYDGGEVMTKLVAMVIIMRRIRMKIILIILLADEVETPATLGLLTHIPT